MLFTFVRRLEQMRRKALGVPMRHSPTSIVSEIAAAAAIFMCAGCGTYLHSDQYAAQATAAKDGFAKIDLTQKFTNQLERVSAFEANEDKAVAAYAVANRDRLLQLMIGLPSWSDTSSVSGPYALNDLIKRDLETIVGSGALDLSGEKTLRSSLGAAEWDPFTLSNNESSLQNAARAFVALKSADDKRTEKCPTDIKPVQKRPENPVTADDWYQTIQSLCREIALASDPFLRLKDSSRLSGGDLGLLIRERESGLTAQSDERRNAAVLQARIDAVIKNAAASKPTANALVAQLKPIQDDLKKATGLVKFLGYQTLADHLSQVLAVELPVTQNSASNGLPTAGASPGTAASSDITTRAQAVVGLALGLTNLNDVYANQVGITRVNSLLLAKAGARHEMAVAKLEIDYDSDMLKIVNAKIDARIRQALHLWEAQTALLKHSSSSDLEKKGFATLPKGSRTDEKIGALAAWIASQDEGEIPYQILRMKEVQLLRAKSVKEGQLGAQGYADLLRPVLAELEAYGQGGLTTQTLVQLLGFAGVITTIGTK